MPAREDMEIALHLSNGTTIDTELPALDVDEPQDELDGLAAELTHRPTWQVIGDVVIFTGALSAVSLR